MNAFVTGCAFVQDKVVCPVCRKLIPFAQIEQHLLEENKKSRSNEIRMRQYGMNPCTPVVMPEVPFEDDLDDDLNDTVRRKRKADSMTWSNWSDPSDAPPMYRGANWAPTTSNYPESPNKLQSNPQQSNTPGSFSFPSNTN